MKSLTALRGLGTDELLGLVDGAMRMRSSLDQAEPVEPVLLDRCVANLFFEPSTRTRLSFDLAAKRLGAEVITFNPGTSSTTKGESLRDTVLTVSAIGADIMVVRHNLEGVPTAAAEWTGKPVVNAGDGTNEHPTQALLDAVTLKRHFGEVTGLTIGIVGDVAHSRVANSLIHLLPSLGADLVVAGPEEWLPSTDLVEKSTSLETLLPDLDVVYLLRVQTERGGVITEDYVNDFRLDERRASMLRDRAIVMHPGPMNRGVEIDDAVADSPRAKMNEQVRNGVPTRMAVFAALEGSLQ